MIITIAMPYINGIIHIGHIYELYISNIYYKIFKKYLKCNISTGLDCHGLIKKNNILKLEFLNKKKINYFNFKILQKKTNTFINKRITNWVFIFFCDKNFFFGKSSLRFFNYKKNFFIPDKYIKIICIKCNFEIENFFCINCKKSNFKFKIKLFKNTILKKNNNIYFKNYIFKDWDITRNGIYNGFNIISKKKIFFYVWFDALISYISNNIFFFKKKIYKINFIQFFGKDIVYFHYVFNVMLKFLNFKKTIFFIHGFIKCKNKISKSENEKILIINKKLLNFFFLINIKNDVNDIKYNINYIKLTYKKIFLNKIINLFFRIIKIFEKYDNKIIDYFFLKKNNIDFYIFYKNNFNFFIKKKIFIILKINKIFDLNKFWKKKNFFLIHYFNSKLFFSYIKKLNFFLKNVNKKKLNNKIYKNFKLFKINNI
ncbi:MAG: class I tRNA ligase family protein [Candidatus Carsonella ruddii]|nr:MAG: class I tRNA ligase family protein [Candidatus Carsonella ruddii]WMC19388.1 MAG: class I tRNA ligase family protein [Candidatus Carsonella ruddii]